MANTTLKPSRGFFAFLLWLCFIPQISSWGMSIQSDFLELRFDENTSRIDLLQKEPPCPLGESMSLGSIQLPGESQFREINKTNFPSMEWKPSGKNRLDIQFSLETTKTSFTIALEIRENQLGVVFDSQPVPEVFAGKDSFVSNDETLERLQTPADFQSLFLLPDLISLRQGQSGDFVLPYQEGTLINFSHAPQKERRFNLFENSGLTMPFWGLSSPGYSEICIVDYLYLQLCYTPEKEILRLRPQFFPDPYRRPVRLQVECLGADKNYIDVAKAYRSYLQERNELPSLAEKLQKKPQLIQLLEGVNIKFPIYMKAEQRPDADGKTPPAKVYHYQSFEDVRDILKDMKEHEINRMMAVWWGWGKEGYDRLHPDILPPNPELGGAKVFAAMTREIADMGYAIGFHDNYTDIYEAAPSFDNGAHCRVGSDGKNSAGGFWAGGQCWLLCSTEGLKFAKRNFDQMKDLGPLNACFIDVLTAAPLFDCYSPVHPHTKWGDMQNKRAMMQLVSDHFGIMGTEHGFSWGTDLCDYMEGITFDPNNQNDFFSGYGDSVPLFAAVYHDAVLQYMHQGAAVQLHTPDRLLINLRAGGSSYFNIVKESYQNSEWKDYLLRAAQISSDTIRRTWTKPLTSHRFLTNDKYVEQCTYGDDVIIVINRSDKEYNGSISSNLGAIGKEFDAVLAPHGFLVASPDYCAIHGSQLEHLIIKDSGWYTFQTPNGEPLRDAKEILMMNYNGDTQLHLDKVMDFPKGKSIFKKPTQ